MNKTPASPLVSNSPGAFTGFKFEHILISVTIAHNREIGQFDDSCSHQIEKGMREYQGILMVDAQAQYKHCSEEQHTEHCTCGLCTQVRHVMQEAPFDTLSGKIQVNSGDPVNPV